MSNVSSDQLLSIIALAGIDAPIWDVGGDAVIVASPLGGGSDLWSFPVDGGAPQRLTSGIGSVGHLSSPLPRRSPDGRFLSYVTGDIGSTELWLQPLDGRPAFQLSRLGANIIGAEWSADSRSLLLAANRTGTYDIYEVSVEDGSHRALTSDERYEVCPVASPTGDARYHVRLDETWTEHHVVRVPLTGATAGEPSVIVNDTHFFDYQYGRIFGTPKVSPDGTTLLFRSYRSGWINIWSVPTSGGEPSPVLPEAADQDHAAWSPDGSRIVMTSNSDASVRLVEVTVADGSSRVLVDPGDGVCAVPSYSPDGSKVAFTLGRPTHAADLHVVDVATTELRRLTRSVGVAVEQRLARPERTSYRGEDGLEIPAFLYLPESAGVEPNGVGVVVVHGGPTMQFFPTYDNYAQFLVSRGYTLLLPNIRGSSGYGRAFEEANDRDWCGGDLRDVVAGAAVLRARAGIDPKRIAITGLSYGGIMSMAATTLAPGVFQAAASLSGYGDFLHMMDEQEFRHQQLLRKELGDPVKDRDIYLKASSIHSVRDAMNPLFIAHGVGRYPQSEAGKQFAEAMEREYKVFEYRTYPGEHYYVYGRDNTRQLWADVDRFLRRYLDLD
jgi:dipeptidyl aminopeptidase/acylaminoacyl peptidase